MFLFCIADHYVWFLVETVVGTRNKVVILETKEELIKKSLKGIREKEKGGETKNKNNKGNTCWGVRWREEDLLGVQEEKIGISDLQNASQDAMEWREAENWSRWKGLAIVDHLCWRSLKKKYKYVYACVCLCARSLIPTLFNAFITPIHYALNTYFKIYTFYIFIYI